MKHSRFVNIVLLSVLILFFFCSCGGAAMSLREAQEVVGQADSLWHEGKMYGADEGDSATLAQAYEAFRHFPLSCGEGRGEVAYHYGRLLREKDDPVAAMQAFLDATRSGTKDYHILGRVYSNIGDICHLAGDFQLSYDMFERSADMFLQNGDSLLYYYDLNNMAFELAEQGKKGETLALLNQIEDTCSDTYLIAKTWETRADAYLFAKQYDSAIYCATISMQSYGITMPTCAIIKAQSFYKLLEMDSALWYANILLTQPDASYQDRFNALYIVQHCDSSVCAESILELSSQREDIRYYEYEPQKEKLSQAVQLLEQDLNRKPDLRWLYAILATVAIIACIIGAYVYRKCKKQELLTQKIDVLEKTANTIQEKKDELSERYLAEQRRIENEIKEKCELLRNDSKRANTLAWNDFDAMCRIIDRQFYMLASKLRNRHILNETETRLCILVLLELSRNEIAQTLPYALNGVGKLKDHTAKKLGTTGKNLHDFLLKLAVEK